jgi:hypothetical protein
MSKSILHLCCKFNFVSSKTGMKYILQEFRYHVLGDYLVFYVHATVIETASVVFYRNRNSPHCLGSQCSLRELFKTLIVIMNLRTCSIYFLFCPGFNFLSKVWILSLSSVNVISMYVGRWSIFQGCAGEYAVGVPEQESYSKGHIGPCSLCRKQLDMLWSSCIQDIWGTFLASLPSACIQFSLLLD